MLKSINENSAFEREEIEDFEGEEIASGTALRDEEERDFDFVDIEMRERNE